jgi:low affinity Fe/Cu permease
MNSTLPVHGTSATKPGDHSTSNRDVPPKGSGARDAHDHEKAVHAGLGFRDRFHRFAAHFATVTGTPWAFLIACLIIVAWAVSGPLFHYSDTWQLVINTGTTIVTFIMVFLIQNTQNRDARAIHLKLDELIKINARARNKLMDLEDWSEQELAELEREFHRLRQRGPRARDNGTRHGGAASSSSSSSSSSTSPPDVPR